jgi:hypothetical protein
MELDDAMGRAHPCRYERGEKVGEEEVPGGSANW